MALVTVKNKFQVVIPQQVRAQIAVSIGDLFEATVERGKITFTPKSVVDRGIGDSLADFKEGNSFGPFSTHRELIDSLRAESKKLKRTPRKAK